ncbi:family 20 glycosylhydrolase, partial [Proteus mirabilis]|nr:family 20 glycosylhydrolase [Proteus mirabilis]
NIVDQEAVLFIEALYKEYAELFNRSRYFHIGGDEFVDFDEIDAYPDLKEAAVAMFGKNGTAMDYFIYYVNQLVEKVSSWGFIPRVWNDGFFRLNRQELVKLSEKVEITYWTKWNQNMAPVETFAEKDYTVINFNDNYFYYVLG